MRTINCRTQTCVSFIEWPQPKLRLTFRRKSEVHRHLSWSLTNIFSDSMVLYLTVRILVCLLTTSESDLCPKRCRHRRAVIAIGLHCQYSKQHGFHHWWNDHSRTAHRRDSSRDFSSETRYNIMIDTTDPGDICSVLQRISARR